MISPSRNAWVLASRSSSRRWRQIQMQSTRSYVRISDEVRSAVLEKRPVVALESTIYTHGYPFPDNLSLAIRLEHLVRTNGAVPATIAVLNGEARVGLSASELQQLLERPHARKLSRRDLAFATATRLSSSINGGTTIAATMIFAHLAGINIFATGGLGGVHKGGESSLDISADLTELGRTPVAVICSGCKGFLDIPRTLEYLETQGVGVATFADGRAADVDFPAFWSRDSGIKSPMTLRSEAEAAAMIHAQISLPLSSGLLFANPVSADSEIPYRELEEIIKTAVEQANIAGATGSENTPFILRAIKDLSHGRSLHANSALVEGNVVRGARVAVELSRVQQQISGEALFQPSFPQDLGSRQDCPAATLASFPARQAAPQILVAGAVALDTHCNYLPQSGKLDDVMPNLHTSNVSQISESIGGVAHNVAKAIQLRGAQVRLCSIVADDVAGKKVLEELDRSGLDSSAIAITLEASGYSTSRYVSVNDAAKGLLVAMADMQIIEQTCQEDFDVKWTPLIESMTSNDGARVPQKWLVVDANWDIKTLHKWILLAKQAKLAIAFEPVSATKAARLFDVPIKYGLPHIVDLATPNELELIAMHGAARKNELLERQDWWNAIDSLGIPSSGARARLVAVSSQALIDEGLPQRSVQLLPLIPNLITKLGSRGVLLTRMLMAGDEALHDPEEQEYIVSRTNNGDAKFGGLYMRLFPPEAVVAEKDIVSVNGAGDTFLGTMIAGLATTEQPRIENFVDIAQRASALTLKSSNSVAPEIATLK